MGVDRTASIPSQARCLSTPSSIKASMNATRTSGGCSAPGFTLQRTRQRVTSTSTASEEGRAVRSTKTAPAMSATGTPPDLHPQTHLCSDCSGAPLSRFFVPRRHLLFCRVILGKSFLQFSAMKMAHSPPGHHSVTGRPSVNGLALAEYVIYRAGQKHLVILRTLFLDKVCGLES